MYFMQRSSQLSNRSMEPGETLFQYLKRKKQVALKQSLEGSLIKSHQNIKQSSFVKVNEQHSRQMIPQSQIKTARPTSRKTKSRRSSYKKHNRKISNSIDSKRSSKENENCLINFTNDIFRDDKTTRRSKMGINDFIPETKVQGPSRRKTPTRSFISMISPLKNRENISSLSNSKPIVRRQQEGKSNIAKLTEFSTKKMIKQAIGKIQKYYNNQVEFEKEVKQKIREFFILLNSFFVNFEDQIQSQSLEKKLKNVKSTIKQIHGYLTQREQTNKQDVENTIDSLYTEVNQVIDSFEGQVHKSSTARFDSHVQRMKLQYEQKISELNKEKTRLTRQIKQVNKENQKMQKDYNKLLEKFNQLEEQTAQNSYHKNFQSQNSIKSLKEEIDRLVTQNEQSAAEIIALEKKLKDSQYRFQQYVRKTNLQKEEKLNERQGYLLKQINLLKAECAADITNINKFYSTKIEQFPIRIKALEDIIEEQKLKMQSFVEKLKDTQFEVKIHENKTKEIKKKLDESVIDLCKINEELWKHWIALKDVKTLSMRLGMFDKFERIYRDIPFDDYLFAA